VEELGDAADRAAARFEQGQRALETLKRFAERHGAVVTERPGQPALFDLRRRGSGAADLDGRHQNAVAQAETTREAILHVMARRPHRDWTPIAVTDDLVRFGRPVARSNVQVTLRRLAADERVRKIAAAPTRFSATASPARAAKSRRLTMSALERPKFATRPRSRQRRRSSATNGRR
jgi:hypothetical protein